MMYIMVRDMISHYVVIGHLFFFLFSVIIQYNTSLCEEASILQDTMM